MLSIPELEGTEIILDYGASRLLSNSKTDSLARCLSRSLTVSKAFTEARKPIFCRIHSVLEARQTFSSGASSNQPARISPSM
ncbi:hypothetical protein OB919_17170 [Halobacteria archaeon AArc-curdl1]|uniref:Uncharacterized protein n=1 Tax=Natronosalvus hydrolyticus TaxID=2979988 RepID=A0AAP2ZAX6_9EURY|nr:hypothetical protein [Halobacteria archaeon AArc-curdl1]